MGGRSQTEGSLSVRDGFYPSAMGKLRVLSCAGSEITKESVISIHLSQTRNRANALTPAGHKNKLRICPELSDLWTLLLPCLWVHHQDG